MTLPLGVLGGRPRFSHPLHVGAPNLGDQDAFLGRVKGLLARRRLTNDGPLVRELEARLARDLDVGHVVAVSSGTLGLDVAARALGLKGEVVLPALTFVATAHALSWQGLTPVFCEVDPVSYTLDPARAAAAITPRTCAVLGVHLWGRSCDVPALSSLAASHGLRLFFDAAHAFGGARSGRPIGGFGDLEVFSFHATKIVNGFEGGAIATHDASVAEHARRLRNFGFEGYDLVSGFGTNAKMSEVHAAMALTSIESLPRFVEINRAHHARYEAAFRDRPGLRLLGPQEGDTWTYQYVVLEIDAARSPLARDEWIHVLWADNVIARRYFHPGAHRAPPYRAQAIPLPVTEALLERVLLLPTGSALTSDDVDGVASLIGDAYDRATSIREALLRHPPPALQAGPRLVLDGV